MSVVERRLELLKLEGNGFNRSEIVKHLSEKFQVSERSVYYDFENRGEWQPIFMQVQNPERAFDEDSESLRADFLGHKKLSSTEIYITIERTIFEPTSDEFTVKVATEPEEVKSLLEVGFEYVCQKDELVFLRKRK